MEARIQIVDEHDQPVGGATKQQAREQGLMYRIIRIMIEDGQGRVLLQHRHPAKDTSPNCWDNSVSGHVDEGEDYDTAAVREMAEELGIQGVRLQRLGVYQSDTTKGGLRFHRFNACYRAVIDPATTQLVLEPGNIDAVRWCSIPEVRQLLADDPAHVTDGLRQVIERYYTA